MELTGSISKTLYAQPQGNRGLGLSFVGTIGVIVCKQKCKEGGSEEVMGMIKELGKLSCRKLQLDMTQKW